MTSREQHPMTSKETPRDPPSSMNDQMIADEKITVSDTLCLSLSAYSHFVVIPYIHYGDRDHQSLSFLSYPIHRPLLYHNSIQRMRMSRMQTLKSAQLDPRLLAEDPLRSRMEPRRCRQKISLQRWRRRPLDGQNDDVSHDVDYVVLFFCHPLLLLFVIH